MLWKVSVNTAATANVRHLFGAAELGGRSVKDVVISDGVDITSTNQALLK